MPMPAGDTRRPPPSLATKLDRLFQAVRPAGRSEYSYQEVADAIRGEGGPTISATYLWQLRKGLRDNPTRNHLAALARFFGVSPAYFFDDDAAEVVDAQLSLLAAMRDASVRSVALRAAGLSVESLAAVQVVIDHARRLEGLEAESGTEDPGAGLAGPARPAGSSAEDPSASSRADGACASSGADGQDGDHAREAR
jgi:transcriptional regulator with XRE-family HTH domain